MPSTPNRHESEGTLICDPVTIGVSLAVLASTASIVQQQQAADTENDYQELVYGQRKSAAFETFVALQERELQERAKASQDIRRVTSQARQAGAAAKLQAIESSTGGQSVDLLYAQFERAELTNVGLVEANLAATSQQLKNEARAAGRLQGPGMSLGPLDTPAGVAASGLGVLSSGFGAYQATKPAPKV